MATPLKLIAVAAAGLGIAGCTSEGQLRWNSESGSQIDDGAFGAAGLHNQLAQSCSGPAGTGGGALKGGAAADPLVVLDPASTPSRPIYRVHCDGQLNGKYAQVIFREYVTSAEPAPVTGIEVEAE